MAEVIRVAHFQTDRNSHESDNENFGHAAACRAREMRKIILVASENSTASRRINLFASYLEKNSSREVTIGVVSGIRSFRDRNLAVILLKRNVCNS